MSERTMPTTPKEWIRENIFLGKTIGEYIKSLITPWNIVAAAILAVGIPVIIYRLIYGLGAATHLSNINPWGLWLGFDMFFGVAVATGGFVMAVGVYIFGLKDYQPMVRPAILTGFLGYFFAIVGLAMDLGRYYRLPYPLTFSMGTASVLFLVAEHLALYLTIQFIEFLPAVVEWLHLTKIREWLYKIHIGAVILGSVLVLGHQSALGAVFLIMPSRLHPLWYSPYLPYLFFVSCLAGGIAMLVVESLLSHKVFGWQVKESDHEKIDRLTLGLGKAAGFVLFAYFALKMLALLHGGNWVYLKGFYGVVYLIEVIGFVLLPLYLYTMAVRRQSATLVRVASVLTVLGIMVNRFNVCMTALNWDAPERYFPSWMEIVLSLTLATFGVIVFKWVVNRMPVLYRLPDFPDEH
jgi:Ni/Fe-hydrogenase subunit HybB-like protein